MIVRNLSFARRHVAALTARLREERRFIQVLTGARQVGKTTIALQAIERTPSVPHRFASADEPTLRGGAWLQTQWDAARLLAADAGDDGAFLVIDEIQKVADWSEAVKRLWDEDTRTGVPLRVVLLGSAPLLVQSGLSESLAGRFELLHVPHWTLGEMRDAFGFDLEQFVTFGGYPGAASLIADPERWTRYVRDSLIEPTIARDVLLHTRVDKPALLRRLFELACRYSGQVLSYSKMVGQLQDAGNTTTLAHYLDLLSGAGMVTGLQKHAGDTARRRASSPKLQVFNTALMTALDGRSLRDIRADHAFWGRLVESAVGAHLLNGAASGAFELGYWRDRDRAVDFVAMAGRRVTAIEVKSGRTRETLPGMDAFAAAFRPDRQLLVGGDGLSLEAFLLAPPQWSLSG
jgi:uncharacterized protein